MDKNEQCWCYGFIGIKSAIELVSSTLYVIIPWTHHSSNIFYYEEVLGIVCKGLQTDLEQECMGRRVLGGKRDLKDFLFHVLEPFRAFELTVVILERNLFQTLSIVALLPLFPVQSLSFHSM